MRTDQRLTEAYAGARVLDLDHASRYVIISDCHRGDGSHSDEFTKNQNIYLHALTRYYDEGFTYVEAGDGDELWEQPKSQHIQNAHHIVFQAIKRFHDVGRLVMLYGNHNIYLKNRAYVTNNYATYYDEHAQQTEDLLPGLDPCEAAVLRHRATGQDILVVHGHQGDFPNDQFWLPTMLSVRYFWRFMHAFGFKNPASPVKNAHKQHKIERNYTKWIAQNRTMLVCGHTHRYKYPRDGELPYFNAGSCIYNTSMTAIEIADGEVCLVRWGVLPNGDGELQVTRQVVHGPGRVGTFDIRDAECTS